MSKSRLLVFRSGSIGDTVVALPCFHLLRRRFSHAHIKLLSPVTIDQRAGSPYEILSKANLVDGVIEYYSNKGRLTQASTIMRNVRQYSPDLIIYLAEPKGIISTLQDLAFFRFACPTVKIVGLPLHPEISKHKKISFNLFESEAGRLARCLAELGTARTDQITEYSLNLLDEELIEAKRVLAESNVQRPFVILCVGGRAQHKDWGHEKWKLLLAKCETVRRRPQLVVVGGKDDRQRSSELLGFYGDNGMNFCGNLSIRQTAAIARQAALFLGHDCGPMHLSASQGVKCVAIFSSFQKPGVWFPVGPGHRVLYPEAEGQGASAIGVNQVFRVLSEEIEKLSACM